MKKNNQPLVSIITPSYNAEKYIVQTIESVLNQTYQNFEMLIVDDMSTDTTCEIVKKYQEKDDRIKFFSLPKKGGASEARNMALREAKGKYIAFLDSDDLWKPEKLTKQINFMEKNNIYFSYTDYEYIDDDSIRTGFYRKSPNKITYFKMLLGDSIGCLTVVYNREKTGVLQIPKLSKRNDYALWCITLKKIIRGYKVDGILSQYRIVKSNTSLSSGKKYKLLKYHYKLHKEINNFNIFVASFFTCTNVLNYVINKKIRDRKFIEM